jgi:hypothetical protein
MKIIANSLPKSGTHLLVRLLELLSFSEMDRGLTGAMIRPTQRNPWKRFLVNKKRCSIVEENCFQIDLDDLNNKIKGKYLDQYLEYIKQDSFVTAHVPFSESLKHYLLLKDIKILYISRDPRSVWLSYYNHQLRDPKYPFHDFVKTHSFEESMIHILSGTVSAKGVKLASLNERIKNSYQWAKQKGVCAVTFESLIGAKGGGSSIEQEDALKKILNYLEVSVDTARMNEICEKIFYTKSETFNKGQIDTWKKVINKDLLRKFDQECGMYLEDLGYDS